MIIMGTNAQQTMEDSAINTPSTTLLRGKRLGLMNATYDTANNGRWCNKYAIDDTVMRIKITNAIKTINAQQ